MAAPLKQTAEYKAVESHVETELKSLHMRDLFEKDPKRFEEFRYEHLATRLASSHLKARVCNSDCGALLVFKIEMVHFELWLHHTHTVLWLANTFSCIYGSLKACLCACQIAVCRLTIWLGSYYACITHFTIPIECVHARVNCSPFVCALVPRVL